MPEILSRNSCFSFSFLTKFASFPRFLTRFASFGGHFYEKLIFFEISDFFYSSLKKLVFYPWSFEMKIRIFSNLFLTKFAFFQWSLDEICVSFAIFLHNDYGFSTTLWRNSCFSANLRRNLHFSVILRRNSHFPAILWQNSRFPRNPLTNLCFFYDPSIKLRFLLIFGEIRVFFCDPWMKFAFFLDLLTEQTY